MKRYWIILLLLAVTIYESQGQTWVQKASLNGNTFYGASGFSLNGKGYVVLGKENSSYRTGLLEYNPVLNTWSSKSNFLGATRIGAISFTIDSTAYIGLGAKADGSITYTNMYQYFPGMDMWVQRANLPSLEGRNAMGTAAADKGYVGGGAIGSTTPYSQKFYEYNGQTNTWTQKANLPTGPRASGLMFGLGGMVYLSLGQNGAIDYNDMWMYDPALDTWTAKASFPGVGRIQANVMVVDGLAIVGGGFELGVGTVLNDYYSYDPVSNTWSVVPSFSAGARSNYATFSIGNTGYIASGRITNSVFQNDLWSFEFASVGLEQSATNASIEFYPNPTSRELFVSTSEYDNTSHTLRIFSLEGKLVMEQNLILNREVSRVSLPELPAGMYQYSLNSNGFSKSGSLVIQH